MKYICLSRLKNAAKSILVLAAVSTLCSCAYDSDATDGRLNDSGQRVIDLKEITPDQAQTFLSKLELGEVSVATQGNAVVVHGTPSDLYRAGVVMDLVDTREEFCIETLAPASNAGIVPPNDRTAAFLGDIAIGTFANPPQAGERTRAIVDLHGSSVVAIVPARVQRPLLAFMKAAAMAPRQTTAPARREASEELTKAADANEPADASSRQTMSIASDAPSQAKDPNETSKPQETAAVVASAAETGSSTEPNACESADRPAASATASQPPAKPAAKQSYDLAPLANGDDVLQLDLPDQVEVIQLLDLAAEYLHIDYMYEPEKIRGQTISLRLHGKLQGDIRVKDLYPLLESVLKFKGFAMTRHKDNIVTIVPTANALEADPTLVDPNAGTGLNAGDMIVTRVFHLQHVNPASAMTLLDNMKMSVASSIVEETRSLIVTGYAHRMDRVERLMEMVDRPGRPKEFRYRELKHTTADALCKKVEMLASELQASPFEIAPMDLRSSSGVQVRAPLAPSSNGPLRTIDGDNSSEPIEPRTVYLDADPRTNRILMVGLPEQLALVEEVIDAMDVAQQDLRVFKSYEIKHVDAEEVRKHLVEFDLVDEKEGGPQMPTLSVDPAAPAVQGDLRSEMSNLKSSSTDPQKPQVSVLAANKSLLINATPLQHVRIAHVIDYVDAAPRQESIPYEIYFLENQDPTHMAEVLHQLLQESVEDKDAKIEKVVRKIDE
ncbi:MAG: secretin N-terminal domain-containing protein, partial [Phycisphaerales bacterium]